MTARPGAPRRWQTVLQAVLALVAFWFLGFACSWLLGRILFSTIRHLGPGVWRWALDLGGGLPLLNGVVMLLGFLAATWIISRGLGYGAVELRWRQAGAAGRGGLTAFGLGLAAAALAMVLAVPLAHAHWLADRGTLADYLLRVGVLLLTLAPAAMAEEVMFRGVPVAACARMVGRRGAVVVVAVFFALAHRTNPNVTPLSLLNIGLAGVALGAALYSRGGMWAAFGLHLGWNWSLAALDAPVSGLDLRVPLIDYFPGGPHWLSGGPFGPEGGILGTAALLALVVVMALRARSGLGLRDSGTSDQQPATSD